MKTLLAIITLLPLGVFCQEEPTIQYANPPANFNPSQQNVVNNDKNIQFQQVVNQNDWDINKNNNTDVNQGGNKQEPCNDCEEIKKKKRENYGNNSPGNYSGGAEKFRRKKAWRRFCYNLTHRSGHKKARTSFGVCFNW